MPAGGVPPQAWPRLPSRRWPNTSARVPADLVVAIGPSIGPCCYVVGQEVVDTFVTAGHLGPALERWFARDPTGRYRLDLWRATVEQLTEVGVGPDNIHAARLCTAHDLQRFFSYRAEGSGTGRMAAVIRARR